MGMRRVGVLVPKFVVDGDEVGNAVAKILQPFNSNIKVVPYRVYVDEREIDELMYFHSIDSDDMEALLSVVERVYNAPADFNVKGIYYTTERNPDAQWSYYKVLSDAVPVGEMENYNISCLVTPSSEWVEVPNLLGVDVIEYLKNMLIRYEGYYIVEVDLLY